MFSLIVVLIAILLVAGLALATLWYGGGAFLGNKARAEAAQLLNEGSQIKGAAAMYENDHSGRSPGSLDDLVNEGYLKDAPYGWELQDNYIARVDITEDACLEANRAVGYDTIPSCGTPEHLPEIPCCTTK